MEETGDGSQPHSPRSDQLFTVVYDPRFDRFFLEDEALHRNRNQTLDRKAVSIPWDKWTLPPKSPPKPDRPSALQPVDGLTQVPALGPVTPQTIENTPVSPALEANVGALNDNANQNNTEAQVPTLDFTSFQRSLAEVSSGIPIETVATNKSKKTRIQDYKAHFERTNQDVAKFIVEAAASAEPSDEHEVKWNGEVISVQVPGLQPISERSGSLDVCSNALEVELLRGSTDKQWPGSTYELKNLMRIRAHADGLRRVNSACRFVALSSSESSDSEEEQVVPPLQESEEEESELMPVFFRDDRVLFHARRRWFKGTVLRRIPMSDFYNIRADNGTQFEAVLASKMELLDEPEEAPYYQYTRGDKVLWIPDNKDASLHKNIASTGARRNRRRPKRSNDSDEAFTYKAKIVQVRSLNQFDVLLRTGRVVKRVPYKQLRPRDASDFVSTTTARRR
ncbi:unnamed protein product [Phytophthora fragariaefolia]|uniref:Unnamed protein product n=1 Tax=Phytophthora fragariaefolia TaxID=1490495 RepID=A0A9W7CWC4_9STRA|nr:unnamed protein product [Phytophthora fragariaefolia]